MKAASPELKGFERKKMLREKWTTMGAEEKNVWEEEAAKKLKEYEDSLAEFKKGENYQKFARVVKIKMKPKAKAKAKAKAVGPEKPKDLPSKPPNAFKLFLKEKMQAG